MTSQIVPFKLFQRTATQSRASQPTTFNDLPNEIALAIFSQLGPRQLMPLFSVSTTFNHLAFTIFLSQYDLSSAENDHFWLYPDSLRGFRNALYLPLIRCITFDCDSPYTAKSDILALARFCRRLQRVNDQPIEVIVDFKCNVFSDGFTDTLREGIAKAVQEFTTSVIGYCSSAVRVTHSAVVVLSPSNIFQPEINFFSKSNPPRTTEQRKQDFEHLILGAFFTVCIVFLWPTSFIARLICIGAGIFLVTLEFSERTSRNNSSFTTINSFDKTIRVPVLSRLRVLHIAKPSSGQPIVVCDPARIKSLRIDQPLPGATSPISPLGCSTSTPSSQISPASTVHASPSSQAGPSNMYLSFSDTLTLLSRHSGITDMIFTCTTIPHPSPTISADLLPDLKHLRACPEFIGFIHDTPGIFPCLEKIEVHVHQRREPLIRALDWALSKMASRKNRIHLEVVIPSDITISDFVEVEIEKEQERERLSGLSAGAHGYAGVSLAAVGALTYNYHSNERDITLPCVKALSLFWFSTETIKLIPSWVKRFSDVGSMTLADVRMTRDDKADMIREIMKNCPKLSTLAIGAKEKPVDEWLNQ